MSEHKKPTVKKRSVGWLIDQAKLSLSKKSHRDYSYLVFSSIDGKEKHSPQYIYDLAVSLVKKHSPNSDAKDFARSARWLAIIRRDYGSDVFIMAVRIIQMTTD